jgi:peptidoglycan-associated lipoprotein
MRATGGMVHVCKIAGVILIALLLAACSRQSKPQDYGSGGYGLGGSMPAEPGTARDFSQNVGDKVFFTTDSSDLTSEAQATLRGQANWLNQYPNYTVMIEGHADERGTREYNIALGARRATAVRNYLAQQGVNPARIRTMSYGKERPVAVCDNISCWSQNRRGVTVLNTRAMVSR